MITWEQLLIGVVVLLGMYYAAVLLLFYRKEVQGLANRKTSRPVPIAATPTAQPAKENVEAILYNQVLELMEDCKPVYQAAREQQLSQEQVIAALAVRIARYPQIKGTAFQLGMTNHIAQELDNRLSMVLTDEDAAQLWP